MTADVLIRLVADLEARSGAPCGRCGLPHRSKEATYANTCLCCPPCRQSFADQIACFLADEYPDLVPPGCRVITEAMIEACMARMEADIARFSEQIAAFDREEAARHAARSES